MTETNPLPQANEREPGDEKLTTKAGQLSQLPDSLLKQAIQATDFSIEPKRE